ncbi:DUF3267 domain-containing protein [Sphingobacterium sp. SRCM116780]|uniref:DUF3267 domain-containing protein n=1 Tax=Sphingobacterium sp. SRCM116780 TaxID=2907623 RepID=UPI001F47A7F4|nr:DUF3267 domain-containing protein [Sphingobacterium sp. SRCM116780]UIR56395.1 DUF3267 domain-containing protein [Sphingobacterium sp. SRCM116780]
MTNLDNYKKDELTINPGKAQILGILYAVPFVLLFASIYYLVWGSSILENPFIYFKNVFGNASLLIIVGGMIVGIVLHELIHGITWSQFAKNGLQSMKFGVIWKYVTPYCHCKEPLLLKHYIIGALMPAIILGFIPSIIAILLGHYGLLVFGLFFTFAAGGDFMMTNLLRKEPMNNLVQDHSSVIGCYVYRLKNIDE